MKRSYQVIGVLLIGFSAGIMREALGLRFSTSLGPGPGFFPFCVAALLAVLGVAMFVQASFGKPAPMPADLMPSRRGLLRIAAILVALAATAALLNLLGFRLTMLAFLLFLLFALGRQSVFVTLSVALAGSWGTYHLFSNWLKVPLPIGVFGI